MNEYIEKAEQEAEIAADHFADARAADHFADARAVLAAIPSAVYAHGRWKACSMPIADGVAWDGKQGQYGYFALYRNVARPDGKVVRVFGEGMSAERFSEVLDSHGVPKSLTSAFVAAMPLHSTPPES